MDRLPDQYDVIDNLGDSHGFDFYDKVRFRKGNDSAPFIDEEGRFVKKYHSLDFDTVNNYHRLHNKLSGKHYDGKFRSSLFPSLELEGQKIENISFRILQLPNIDTEYKAGDYIYPQYISGKTIGDAVMGYYSATGLDEDYIRNTFLASFQHELRLSMERIMALHVGKDLARQIFGSFWIENTKFLDVRDNTLSFVITDLGGSIFHLIHNKEIIDKFLDEDLNLSRRDQLKSKIQYYLFHNVKRG